MRLSKPQALHLQSYLREQAAANDDKKELAAQLAALQIQKLAGRE